MSLPRTLREHHKPWLQSHVGFARVPFCKNLWPSEMVDSRSQREVLQGLLLWLEIKVIAVVTGQSGIGKSVTVRGFVHALDDARFRVVHLTAVPTTPYGFLLAVNRVLGLPMRSHATDLPFVGAHAFSVAKVVA